MDWRQKVREWLEENDRSQAWLARKAGLDASWVSQVLAGKQPAGLKTLRAIEDALELDRYALGAPTPVEAV